MDQISTVGLFIHQKHLSVAKTICFFKSMQYLWAKSTIKERLKTNPERSRPQFCLYCQKLLRNQYYELKDYFKKNDLPRVWPIRFKWNFAIDLWLPLLADLLLSDIDNKTYTSMIVIDLQKTFGTLDHKTLLEIMICLGFKTSATKNFESYPSHKKFFVPLGDFFSKTRSLDCGVPEEAMLRLLLFLIHINALPQSSSGTESYLYTYDT